MAKTKLRQLLEYIENNPGITSLGSIARELDMSVGQAENMLEFWERKGRVQRGVPAPDCSSCASSGGCPYLEGVSSADHSDGQVVCLAEEA